MMKVSLLTWKEQSLPKIKKMCTYVATSIYAILKTRTTASSSSYKTIHSQSQEILLQGHTNEAGVSTQFGTEEQEKQHLKPNLCITLIMHNK